MSMSDPVADMLTRLRNAQMAKHAKVKMPASKLKIAIAALLKAEGYIENYSSNSAQSSGHHGKSDLTITLKYHENSSVLQRIERVSRPGLRVYKKCADLPKVMGGLGIAIVSTPKGLMTDHNARRNGLGGEIMCYVA